MVFRAIILITCVAGCLWTTEAEDRVLDSLLRKGNVARNAFDNEQAMEWYSRAHTHAPASFEAFTKMVRAYVDLAEDIRRRRRAEELLRSALVFTDTLRDLFPDSVEAHFLVALAGANLAFHVNGREKLNLSGVINDAALKAIELDPSHAPSHVIMGGYHRHVATTSDFLKALARWRYGKELVGSLEDSERYLRKAVALDPSDPYAHLELAKTYLEMDNSEHAHKHLRILLRLPVVDHRHSKLEEEARELLEG
jgi:tetratricopeptide (TPR) repeat protein